MPDHRHAETCGVDHAHEGHDEPTRHACQHAAAPAANHAGCGSLLLPHQHVVTDFGRAFAIGVALNITFVIVELTAGWWANSLALISDAGHNLSDVLGLLLAWGAHHLARLAPSPRRTYGWGSSTILAALANAFLLLVALGGLAWEAIERLQHPQPAAGSVIVAVSLIGVVINTATAALFASGRHDDLNIRGAYLHMAADAAISLSVAIAGGLILWTGWNWLDPASSLAVAVVILAGTWGLLRESLDLALHAVPSGIDVDGIRQYLLAQPGVTAVHHLHIWGLSTTRTALTVHVERPSATDPDDFLRRVTHDLRVRYRISQATIQVEQQSDRVRPAAERTDG